MRLAIVLVLFMTFCRGGRADPSAARQAADRRAHPELVDPCNALLQRNCPSAAASHILTLIDSKVALCRAVADSPICKSVSDEAIDKSKFRNCEPSNVCHFNDQSMLDADTHDCVIKGLGLQIPGKAFLTSLMQSRLCDENQDGVKSAIIDSYNSQINSMIEKVKDQLKTKSGNRREREAEELDFGGIQAATEILEKARVGEDLKSSMVGPSEGRGAPCAEIQKLLQLRRASFDRMLNKLVAANLIEFPPEPLPIAEAIRKLKLNIECYSPKAKGELLCEVAVMAASSLAVGGITSTVKARAILGLEKFGASRANILNAFGEVREGARGSRAIPAKELSHSERFDSFPDRVSRERFSEALRGSGNDNDFRASRYVDDRLNHSPPGGGLVTLQNTVRAEPGPDPVRLITPKQFEGLPNGTVLVDVSGKESVIKGAETIDLDTRGGYTAYGFRESDLREIKRGVGSVPPAELKEIAENFRAQERTTKLKADVAASYANEFSTHSRALDSDFKARHPGQTLAEAASTEDYHKIQLEQLASYERLSALNTRNVVGKNIVMEWSPDGKTKFVAQGKVTYSSPQQLDITDRFGHVFSFQNQKGRIEKIFLSASIADESTKLVPKTAISSAHELAIQRRESAVAEYQQAQQSQARGRNTLSLSSSLQNFSTAKEKQIFFDAAARIRSAPLNVPQTKELALKENIRANVNLGRTPHRIDSNGLPVYSPGQSFFRAMVVRPTDAEIARNILTRDGWKSGLDRGVSIDQKIIGTSGNGATRLSNFAKLEDAVVEFVGPKVNLGPGFENGFPFPRDSKVVGVGSSSAVADVAAATANQPPEGSFLMITEIVPRNRQLIDSDKLFQGRNLQSKFPLSYKDGGVEHAVTGVNVDEIVNVIFIPIH